MQHAPVRRISSSERISIVVTGRGSHPPPQACGQDSTRRSVPTERKASLPRGDRRTRSAAANDADAYADEQAPPHALLRRDMPHLAPERCLSAAPAGTSAGSATVCLGCDRPFAADLISVEEGEHEAQCGATRGLMCGPGSASGPSAAKQLADPLQSTQPVGQAALNEMSTEFRSGFAMPRGSATTRSAMPWTFADRRCQLAEARVQSVVAQRAPLVIFLSMLTPEPRPQSRIRPSAGHSISERTISDTSER